MSETPELSPEEMEKVDKAITHCRRAFEAGVAAAINSYGDPLENHIASGIILCALAEVSAGYVAYLTLNGIDASEDFLSHFKSTFEAGVMKAHDHKGKLDS